MKAFAFTNTYGVRLHETDMKAFAFNPSMGSSCCSELYFTAGAFYSLLPLFFPPHFFVPPSARVGLYARFIQTR